MVNEKVKFERKKEILRLTFCFEVNEVKQGKVHDVSQQINVTITLISTKKLKVNLTSLSHSSTD